MQLEENKKFLFLGVVTAVVLISGLILVPVQAQQQAAQQGIKPTDTSTTTGKTKVKPEKPTKEKPADKKVKLDKAKEKAAKAKKAKQTKSIRFEVIVDGSAVGNLTDALQNYEFTVSANGQVSKAKMLDDANLTEVDDISNMQIVFNAKGMNVTDGDQFSATATSLSDGYQTVSTTGTVASQTVGQSTKTRTVGTTDEPLVLADVAPVGEEPLEDDF